MNDLPRRTTRIALMISGGIDALIGSVFLLIGFHLLPVDITQYGFENWYAFLCGGLFFIIGIGIFVYNFSRLEE